MGATSWQDAHRVANLATAQARHDLQVPSGLPRVDIDRAIRQAGVILMWRPLPTVFGAYLNEPGSQPGILLNNQLPAAARRYTAAHELGHHWLQHTTSVDDDRTVDITDRLPVGGRRGWTAQEKAAEAFAAWFLMPRQTVVRALAVLGLDRPRDAVDCYRLSLLLGAPYRTTVRHLQNLRFASAAEVNAWLRIPPGRVKARADRGAPAPARRDPDVWLLDPGFADLDLELQLGDRLVLPHTSAADLDLPGWLRRIGCTTPDATGGAGVVMEIVDTCPDPQLLTLTAPGGAWSVSLRCHATPLGLDWGSGR